jgi:hypothetical protein
MIRSDEELMASLGRALEAADPMPPWLLESAKSAYVWRTIDAELAELVFDSAVDELVGVRSTDTARQVTFRGPGVEVEVMIAGATRRLVGQLIPPQSADVELLHGGMAVEAVADRLGRFSFEKVEPGPVQLRMVTGDRRSIMTQWVVF